MDLLEVIVQGITLGSAYAVMALGFAVVFKASKILNLAYGAIVMMLGYILAEFTVLHDVALWISIPALFVIGASMCFVLERISVRRLIGQPFLASLVATLALGLLLNGIAILIWGGKSFAYTFFPVSGIELGEIMIMPTGAWAFVAAVVVFTMVFLFFRYTKLGLQMRAVSEKHVVAQSLGVRVKRIFSLSWVMSGVLAVVAAIILGGLSVVDPELANYGLAKGLPVLLLGGMASTTGALVGGITIGVAESVAGYYGVVREIIPWIIMLLILLIRPEGLFGERRIERI